MADWARKYFQPGGGDALLLYLIYGEFAQSPACPRGRYDTGGLPEGVEMTRHTRCDQPDALEYWATAATFHDLVREARLEDAVFGVPDMLRIQGVVRDPNSLQ
jgi:hypothetical protein